LVAAAGSDTIDTLANFPISVSRGALGLRSNGSNGWEVDINLTLAGGTCSNQFIRSIAATGAITCSSVALAPDVTGTLGVGNGGTGVGTTPTNGQLLIGNGSGFSLATLTQGAKITITNFAGGIT